MKTNPNLTGVVARRATGFTLIELLVVIAIIAILLTVLMPALKTARDKTKSIQCRNQLRQISLAANDYGVDYNDFIPMCALGSYYCHPDFPTWYCQMAPYFNIPTLSWYSLGNESWGSTTAERTLKKACMFTCPISTFSYPHPYPVSYAPPDTVGANAPLRGQLAHWTTGVMMDFRVGEFRLIKHPSSRIWIQDHFDVTMSAHASAVVTGRIDIFCSNATYATRTIQMLGKHKNCVNAGFFDGHVERVEYERIKAPGYDLITEGGCYDPYR